jgi:glucosamine--fructose-6-phosphate aminotransferase (isomerizing)
VVSIGPGRSLPAAEGLCEELAPIALIVPAQLVAEHLAVLRGRDPDRPPGLTKVTRTH